MSAEELVERARCLAWFDMQGDWSPDDPDWYRVVRLGIVSGQWPVVGEWVEYGEAPSWMVPGSAEDPHDGYRFDRDGTEGGMGPTGTVWAMVDDVKWYAPPEPVERPTP